MQTHITTQNEGQGMPVKISALNPHPLNRKWKDDDAFASLEQSIRQWGVLTPILVSRRDDGTLWIIAGERRWRAAHTVPGMETIPAVVRRMTEAEELEVLVIENLQREDPDPVEEARLVAELLSHGYDKAVLAERLSRSVEWIETRQLLLDLGEEVHECLRRPRDAEGHLSIGAAMAIVAVPAMYREDAVQLVLHPDYQDGPLSATRAHAAVKAIILDPIRRKQQWEAMAPKLRKAWLKRLREVVGKELATDIAVVMGEEDEILDFPRQQYAEEMIQGRYAVTAAGMGKTWAHLAARHGLAVRILPWEIETEDATRAVVDTRLLAQAEQARAENGMDSWIAWNHEDEAEEDETTGPVGVGYTRGEWPAEITLESFDGQIRSFRRDSPATVKEGEDAFPCGLDANPYDREKEGLHWHAWRVGWAWSAGPQSHPDEIRKAEEKRQAAADDSPSETVIEQTVESYAQVRLSEVRRLGRLAMTYEDTPAEDMAVPDWVPRWAEIAFNEGRAADVSDVCEWVMGLRAGC